MTEQHRFALGDRVITTKSLRHIAAGRIGTVVHLYPVEIYEVQIDGEYGARIVPGTVLAPAPLPKDS